MSIFKRVARPDFAKIPELPLPLYVRSTGLAQLDPDWCGPGGDNAQFVQIFWGISGSGILKINDEEIRLGPRDVATMQPSESHRYQAGAEPWTLRWFTFDGTRAADFINAYGYPRLIKGAGPCPDALFDALETALREMTPFRQRRLVALTAEILALAGGSDEDGSPQGRIAKRFVDLAQKNYSNGSVNVNSLADMIGVHRTTLSRLFKEKMLLSPSEYLERLRMQHALAMLKETDLPVAEVAERVGIPDPAYFSRAVRKATGMSPRACRIYYAGTLPHGKFNS